MILLLIPKIQSQSNDDDDDPPPLCITQLALVNSACAFLHTRHDDDDGDSSPPSPPNDDNDNGGDDPGRVDNGDGQSLVDANDGDDRRHHHHHHHRRRNRQGRGNSDREQDCCRWLKEVDDECVCALLLRLPPFLTKLEHEYTVEVNDQCNVTYECEGLSGV